MKIDRGFDEVPLAVGVCTLVLAIPGNHSLKGKRQAIKSVIERVRSRYNVSIAEVGGNDTWQRAVLGIAAVSNERNHLNQVLDKIVHYVQGMTHVEVWDYSIELL